MMKFKSALGLILASMTVSTYAIEYDYSGQLRLRTLNKDVHDSDRDLRNVTQLRARLNLDVKLSDNLKFHMSPQAIKDYGEVIAQANDEGDTAVNSSGDKYSSSVDLFEAYVDGKRGDVNYRLGRQQLVYGESIALGARNWVSGGQSFDAFKFTVPVFKMSLDLVYSQISEGSQDRSTKDDSNLTFAYLKMIEGKETNLDFYIMHNQKKTISETISYGFRFKKILGSHQILTENLVQEDHEDHSIEHNINAGYEFSFMETNKFFLGYSQASANYDQLYTNRHLYNGISDIVGRKNLETFNGGFKKKINDFNFRLEYLFFRQQNKGVGAYNQATSGIITGDKTKKNIGQEVDFIVNYKLSPNENIQFAASQFYQGEYFSDRGQTSFFYLEYLLTF